ncbi:MAG: hypothetical protein KIS66_04820 [Fimbriimonadaceae bacterium]|nr:hypothetical protein [Fimbriimonadaceae bacterium]
MDSERPSDSSRGVAAKPEFSEKFLSRIRNYTNPLYHCRRMADDLASAYHALRNWNYTTIRHDEGRLAKAFRGKLFAAFFFSGAFMIVAVALGVKTQFDTNNRYVGVFATMAYSMILTTAAYQVFWAIANVDFYHYTERNFWARFLQLERDLWPVHRRALQMALVVAFIIVPINLGIAWAVGWLPAHVADYVPMGVIVAIVNVILIDSTVVRAMGDKFDEHSRVLAEQYAVPGEPADPPE